MKDVLSVSLRDTTGPITTLLQRLAGDDGGYWLWALKRFLRKENPWGLHHLIQVNMIEVPEFTLDRACVENCRMENVFIDHPRFRSVEMLTEGGTIHSPAGPVYALRPKNPPLLESSTILNELEPGRIGTTAALMWQLMGLQKSGEEGFLLTNGRANYFYLRHEPGHWDLRYCRWNSGGYWEAQPSVSGNPNGMLGSEYQVICR